MNETLKCTRCGKRIPLTRAATYALGGHGCYVPEVLERFDMCGTCLADLLAWLDAVDGKEALHDAGER